MRSILFALFCTSLAFADSSFFSKDIGNTIPGDTINDQVYLKRKISFGADGSSTDVSSTNPFPVICISGCSGGSGGGTVNQGIGGASPWLVTGSIGRTWSLLESTDSVSSWIFDASGNPIGSTTGALNTFVTNSSLAVTGTFFQATQPISGTISVNNFPATQPVSGSVSITNFPATQNVNVTNTSIPVTGTFFQSTQPVSGNLGRTWTLSNTTDSVNVGNFPTTQNVNVTNSSLAVTGTFFQAVQPVSQSGTWTTGRTWASEFIH